VLFRSIKPWTLEGDSRRGPATRHRLVAISTDRLNDLSVNRLLDIPGATALALKRIDHTIFPINSDTAPDPGNKSSTVSPV
jgi:hypothetical protein